MSKWGLFMRVNIQLPPLHASNPTPPEENGKCFEVMMWKFDLFPSLMDSFVQFTSPTLFVRLHSLRIRFFFLQIFLNGSSHNAWTRNDRVTPEPGENKTWKKIAIPTSESFQLPYIVFSVKNVDILSTFNEVLVLTSSFSNTWETTDGDPNRRVRSYTPILVLSTSIN